MKRGFRRAMALALVFCGGAYALALNWHGFAPLPPTGHGLPGGLALAAQGFSRNGKTIPLFLQPLLNLPETAALAPTWESAPVLSPAPPVQVRLDVPHVLQLPQLPNGCEATSLAMALQYRGLEVDKMALAYGGIPRQDFVQKRYWLECGNPDEVYAGDPGGYGYYCYPPVIAEAANRQLAENGAAETALDISGASEIDLLNYLAGGTPVIAWITVDDTAPQRNPDATWLIAGTEEEHTPYSNLHVVVLTGFDEENYYMNDPLGRLSEMPRQQFMSLFRQMQRRAVVIEA